MSVSDILALISLVVSAFAFLISFLTYVYTVALGPRLDILFGENIWLHYTEDYKLCIMSYFVFFNGGAQPGAIVNLSGTLAPTRQGMGTSIRWNLFGVDTDIQAHQWGYSFTPESSPHSLIVAGRGDGGTTMKRIELQTDEAYQLLPGMYRLQLQGLVGPKLTRWSTTRLTLVLTSDDIRFLNSEQCRANESGVYRDSLGLGRQAASRGFLVSAFSVFRKASATYTSKDCSYYIGPQKYPTPQNLAREET